MSPLHAAICNGVPGVIRTVRKPGAGVVADFNAIQQAVINAIGASPLGSNWCINVDSSTYFEQVKVENIAFLYSTNTLTIQSDPGLVSTFTTVNPPVNSTAAFRIMNSSVNIFDIAVVSTNSVPYGVYASSAYVQLSSVSVSTFGNLGIYTAGARVSSWSAISFSTVSVVNAHGIWLDGGNNTTIYNSTAISQGVNIYGLYLNAADSNTVTGCSILNTLGDAVHFENGADYNAIDQSVMTSSAAVRYALYMSNSDSNTVTRSMMYNSAGDAARLDAGSDRNEIVLSMMTGGIACPIGGYGLMLVASSSNTIDESLMMGAPGTACNSVAGSALFLGAGSNYNTIKLSTMTGGDQTNFGGPVVPGGHGSSVTASSFNTFLRNYMKGGFGTHPPAAGGNGLMLLLNSNSNMVVFSTMVGGAGSNTGGNGGAGLYVGGSSSGTINNSVLIGGMGGWGDIGAGGGAAEINGGSSTTINWSLLTGGVGWGGSPGAGGHGFFVTGGHSNTVNLSFITGGAGNNAAPSSTAFGGNGVHFSANANNNSVRQSTATGGNGGGNGGTTANGGHGLYAIASKGNSIDRSSLSGGRGTSPHGYGGYLDANANNNDISQSTMTVDWFTSYALFIVGADSTSVSGSNLFNSGGTAVYISTGADFTTISASSIVALGVAVSVQQSSYTSVAASFIQGFTAMSIAASTGTTITANSLVTFSAQGIGFKLSSGSVGLSMSSNTVTANNGSGVILELGDGALILSSNSVSAGGNNQCAICVTAQASGASVWIASNTILPVRNGIPATYGLLISGLTTGATIQDNNIYYRVPGAGAGSAYALYAQSSSGLRIDHNRINEPNMLAGITYTAISFNGVQNSSFKFNDVYSSGTVGGGRHIELFTSTVTVRNNIFQSSNTVPTDAVFVSNDSGYLADYNNYLNSTQTSLTLFFDGLSRSFPWSSFINGGDSHSASGNPLWASNGIGVEDFHQKSSAGRYNPATRLFDLIDTVDAPTIDLGDPLEPLGAEPNPNGGAVNMGSYGGTAQASKSPPRVCPVVRKLCKSDLCAYHTIRSALDAVPNPLTAYSCVLIKDSEVYAEKLVLQNFTNNNSSMTLMLDPSLSVHPVLTPSSGGSSVFEIRNASFNVVNIDIRPAGFAYNYGVLAASANITLNGVNVIDPEGRIDTVGMSMSGDWSSISNSSVNVGLAMGMKVSGQNDSIWFSTATNQVIAYPALDLSSATGGSFTGLFARNNGGGNGAKMAAANSNSISLSTLSASSMGVGLLLEAGSSSNSVSGSYIDSGSSMAVSIGLGAVNNTISRSTAAANTAPQYALYMTGSSNTVSQSFIRNRAGTALYLGTGSSTTTVTGSFIASGSSHTVFFATGTTHNTISQSTVTGSSSEYAAIYLVSVASNSISQSYISGGVSTAVYMSAASSITFSQTTIVSNTDLYSLFLTGGGYNRIAGSTLLSGAHLDGGTMYNAFSQSILRSNSTSAYALFLHTASSNSVTQSFIENPSGDALHIGDGTGAHANTISQSTMTSGSAGGGVALFVAGSSNVFTANYVENQSGNAAIFDSASANAVFQSTFASTDLASYGLFLNDSPRTILSRVTLLNPVDGAARITFSDGVSLDRSVVIGAGGLKLEDSADFTVTLSTLIGDGIAGLWLEDSLSPTISNSYIQGSTGVYVTNSDGTVIQRSMLAGTGAYGSGVWFGNLSMNLDLLENTILGGGQAAVSVGAGNFGTIIISTNLITARSAQYGVYAANQGAGATVWVTSNTILPGLTASAGGAYGLYLDGLLTGATIQNNGIYYRSFGAAPGGGAFGFYANSSSGIKFDHNRISNPGRISGALFVAATLNSSPSTIFHYNDLYSSGTVTTFTGLKLINSNGSSVQNNIFSSSITATTNRLIDVDAGSQVGFSSDYNDFFSSNSVRSGVWGGVSYSLLLNWRSNTGHDANSITENPLWLNTRVGEEDFHPLSTGGRWDGVAFSTDAASSPTIDRGDTSSSIGVEPVPNGGRPNMGSYGQTAEASLSVMPCYETVYVRQAGGADATSITAALGQISNPMTGHACVVIEDSAIYNEQVRVQNFITNGSSITIMLDPAITAHPTVTGNGQTAAFLIKNASVNIVNIDVTPTVAVPYGILVSSPNASISNVAITAAGANISVAGVALSSYATLSNAQISVVSAHGLYIDGSYNSVSYTTMTNNNGSFYPLYILGGGSNTITQAFMFGAAGASANLDRAHNNVISLSTIANNTNSAGAFNFSEAHSNTLSQDYIYGGDGVGIWWVGYSSFNTVVQSTVISAQTNGAAIYLTASSNTIIQSMVSNAVGYGLQIVGGNSNSIVQSTITSAAAANAALYMNPGSSNTVTGSYIQGATGPGINMASGSSYNAINQSAALSNGGAEALLMSNADWNSVDASYIYNPVGYGLYVTAGSDNNAVSRSTMTSLAGNNPLTINNSRFNSVTASFMYHLSGEAAVIMNGASDNTISLSTMTTNSSGRYALKIIDADSNTVTGSYVSNPSGDSAFLTDGADYNVISQSSMDSAAADPYAALRMTGPSNFNVVSESFISNALGYGARFDAGANNNTISLSTVVGGATNVAGVLIARSSFTTLSASYVQGSTAVYVFGSTGAVVSGSVLAAMSASGNGLWLIGGSVGFAMSSNLVLAGAQAAGVYLDAGNSGAIDLSTNVLRGGRYGVFAATQAAGTQLWVASNTIVVSISNTGDTYGLYADGLLGGATIQNNGIYYRASGSMGTHATFGLYAKTSAGLVFANNRISNPGMITAGSIAGAYLSDADNVDFRFNDLYSTGTALTDAVLLRLGEDSSGLNLKNNIFFSSFAVTGSSATIMVDGASQAGFASDYNNFFSTNTRLSFVWGALAAQATGWMTLSGGDWNSISKNPRWFNPTVGVEDFHPLSQAGRWNGTIFTNDGYTSATIDAADPLASVGAEDAPNGSRANLGSFGGTAEASRSPAAPSAPVIADVFMSSITITYGTSGADRYTVEASTAANFSGTVISSSSAGAAFSPLSPQNLIANTTYFLRIGAVWGDLFVLEPSVESTSTLANPPALAAATFDPVGSSSAALSWLPNGNPLDVTTYTVVMSTGSVYPNAFAGNVTLSTTPPGAAPLATVAGLVPNTTYFGYIAAVNWNSVSSAYLIAGATATLAADPLTTASTFTSVAITSFTVSWKTNGNPLSITTYTVMVSTAPDFLAADSVAFSTVPAAGPTATFTGLSANTTYYFRVRAIDHESRATTFVNLGSTTTLPVSLQAPVVAGFTVNTSSITATWSLAPTATGYTLIASTMPENPPTAIFASSSPVGVTATTATLVSLNPNTTYFIFVQASGPGAATAFAAYTGTATLAALPVTAVSTFTDVQLTSMTVSWLPNGNPVEVTSYTVVLSTGSTYPNTFAGNTVLSTRPAGGNLTASFSALKDNTRYYLHVSAFNHAGAPTVYAALGSTVTPIAAPTAVIFDEISSHTIVVSAYAPAPYFSNLGVGLSGTRQAKGGAYQAVHGEQWVSTTSLPAARSAAAAAAYNGKIYFFGGEVGGIPQSAVAVYDPETSAWTSLTALSSARSNLSAASVGGKIYVLGGTNDSGATAQSKNEEYDPAANSWATKAVLTTPRSDLSAVAVGEKLYAFGGLLSGLVASGVNEQYDPAADQWTSKASFAAAGGRNKMSAAAVAGPLAGTIYAAGGAGPSADNSVYDTGANAWTPKTALPSAVEAGGAASLGGKVYVVGGLLGAAPVYEYDPATFQWTVRAPMITGRTSLSVAAAGGRIYAMGGMTGGPDSAVSEMYDPGVATKFTGLNPNQLYSFKTQARNQVGTLSAETALVSTYTLAALPVAAAPAFTFVAVDSVTFQWGENGNPAGTKYQARASTSSTFGGGAAVLSTEWGAMVSTAIVALSPNTTYFFQVKARNDVFIETAYVALGSTATLASIPATLVSTFSSVGVGSLTASWSANGNPLAITTYTVTVSSVAGFAATDSVTFSTAAAGAVPTATFTGLNPNTSYYFRVAAINHNGIASNYAELGSTMTLFSTLPVPAVAGYSIGSSSIAATWSLSAGATGYTLVASTAPASPPTSIFASSSPVGVTATTAALTGLVPNTTYYLFVRANANLTSSFYAAYPVTATLAADPATVVSTFSSVSQTALSVNWSANGNPVSITTYTVEISTASDFNLYATSVSFSTVSPASPSAGFTGLNGNTTYYFRVSAVNVNGLSTAFINLGSTSTLASAPVTAVSTFSAVEVTSMTVSWLSNGNPADATLYSVLLSTGSSYPNSFASNTVLSTRPAGGSPAATFTGLNDNTRYYLYVAAVNNAGVPSAYAALGSTVTRISPPTAVIFDEISSNTIVASAYAPTPLFSNLGTGLSGTHHAIGVAAYNAFHGEGWTAKASMTLARGELAAANYNGKVYVFGGSNGGTPQTKVESYDPAANAWTTLTGLPSARTNFAAAVVNGKIHVVGGTNDLGTTSMPNNDQYDPVTNSWLTTKVTMPTSRSHLSAVAVGDALYAFGGFTNGVATGANEKYDPANDLWTSKTPFPSAQNRVAAAAVAGPMGGLIYAAGGNGPVNDNFVYDTGADAWAAKTAVPSALAAAGAASLGGKIYVVGGGAGTAPVYEYDPATNLWAVRAGMITGRSELGVAAAGGRIYAVGGSAPDSAINEEYDPGVATKYAGLTPNTLYTFKAQARNQVGQVSPETASVSTYTWAALPDAAAASFTLVEKDSITVQWGSNGNPAGTQYRVRASTAANFSGALLTSDWGVMNSTGLTGLSVSATYFFQAQARNAVFIETAYTLLGSTSTLAMPPAATAPPFSSIGSNVMSVSWLPNGNPVLVTTYSVVMSTGSSYPNTFAGNVAVSTRPMGTPPTASVTGLVLNTTYYAYAAGVNANGVVSAYTALGATSTLADLPLTVASTFTNVGLTDLTASWSPNGNAVSITTYTVELSTAADFNMFAASITFSTIPVGALPTASFTGLNNNTTYYFRVAALNNNGTPTAFVSLGSTTTVFSSLSAPAGLAFTDVSRSSIAASWSLSATATGYTLVASTQSNNPPTLIWTSSTTSDINETAAAVFTPALNANTTYYLFVRANGLQTSSLYAAFPATATLANVPATAVSTYTAVTSTKAVVRWTANSNPVNVTTYTVHASTAADFNAFASSVTFSTAPAGVPSATITGLSANTTYYFRVRAVNHNGMPSLFVNLGSTATLAALPAVADPAFVAVDIDSMTVSWLENGNPLDITTYSVVLTTGSVYPNTFAANTPVLSTSPAGTPLLANFSGLSFNTTYFAFVAAANVSGGRTAYVLLGTTSTLAAEPATVVTTFTAVNASSFTVSWSANGNPLSMTTYTVQLSTASDFNEFASSVTFSTAPVGAPSATFTGLSGLTNYFFRVAAVNSNGVPSTFVNLGSVVTNLNALPAPVIGAVTQVNISSIAATWSLVAGATGYTLAASALSANPPVSIAASSTPVGDVLSATALAPALNPNTTYYLFVRANGDQVASPYAAYPATSTLANMPATVVSTFSGVFVTSISVNWSANGNPLSMTTYTVQLSTASDFNAFATSTTFSTAPVGAPSASFAGLSGGTTYYFRVRAVNNNGMLTAFADLGSTVTMPTPLFPAITSAQTGDATWRRSNTGLYNVSFGDPSGSHLDKFQVKASTTAGGLGTDLIAFTDALTGLSPSDTYNTPWALPAAVFNSLIEGVTNYISVRVINGLGNATTLQDAFYVQKDTTAPNMVNAQTGDATVRAAAGTTYDVKVFDASSGLAAFQYSASLSAGSGNAALIAWTDIAAVANSTSYTTAWPVNFTLLASGVTNYISVRTWDTSGTTTTLVDAFYVLKDTAGPSVSISTPTNSSFPSSLGLIGGTAASLFGVQGNEVSVREGAGSYWNGSAFLSASPVWMAATGTTAWSLAPGISWVDGTTYQVVARSSTTFNQYSTTYATATFTFDSSTPTVAVTAPAPDSTVAALASIAGTAADAGGTASGVASVQVQLRRFTDGRWWNWFTDQWAAVAVSTVASGTTSWLVTPSNRLKAGLDSGTSYFIAVRASDNAVPPNQGDFFVSGATFTWQDVTAPGAIADLAATAGSTPGHLNLSWTARGDDGATGLVLTGQYRIFYSTDIAAVPSTATAQVVISTSLVNPGDAQSRLLTGLNPGGTYYLHVAMADSDGNWSVFSNQATNYAAPAPTDQINGHVVNLSTEGITAVQVDCWDSADNFVATTFTLADGSGTFSLGGLSPGNYKLKVTWTVNGVSSSLWQDGIAMGASGVDFVLEINYALATLTGTLGTLTTSSMGGARGLGVSSLQSAVSNSNSRIELYQRGRQVSMVQVQPSGRWTIPSLLPGRYSVRAFTGLAYTDFQDVDLAEGEFKTLGFVFDPLPEATVFAFPNPARTSTTIRFVTVLAPLEAQVLIFDIAGNVVREFPGSQINAAAAPTYRVDWDLNNSRGQAVAPGVYIVMVKIKGGTDNQSAKVVKKLAVVR